MRSSMPLLRFGVARFIALPLALFLVVPPISRAQDAIPKRRLRHKQNSVLVVGSQVVLKASDTPLDDNGKAVRVQDNLRIWIEKIDGERLFLVVSDVFKSGWVRSDQGCPPRPV